ncbi:MAG: S8 family serine peptidase [Blastocatellia bacterium]
MLYCTKVRSLALLLILLFLTGLVIGPAGGTGAQTNDQLSVKADGELRRAWELFRTQGKNNTASQATRARQEAALRNHIGMEERDGKTWIGVNVMLKEADEEAYAATETQLASMGFHPAARIGNVLTLRASVNELPALAIVSAIQSLHASRRQDIEAEPSRPVPVRDKAALIRARRLMNNLVNSVVRASEARSTYNVTGRGVIIGVIDAGVDFRHRDFRNADGTTRIKLYWDMSQPEGTGPGGLGRVFTESEINQTLQGTGPVTANDTIGHGSHVTGIAAGNGLGAGTGATADAFRGIAPEATLLIVKGLRPGAPGFYDEDLISSLAWLRTQAQTLNLPISVNMSIGGQDGNRDGSDPVEVAIDNFVASGPMRHFSTSAGNTGSRSNHAGGVIAQGAEVTLDVVMSFNSTGVQVIYNGADNITARVTKPNGTTLGPVTLGSSITSDPDFTLSHASGTTGNGAKLIELRCDFCGTGIWKIILKGESIRHGRYDAWSLDTGNTYFSAASADLRYEIGHPKGIRRGNVVANFISRNDWVDVNGANRTRTTEGTTGNIAVSSSGGPARDGRIKPNLAAPGAYIFSTLSAERPAPTTADTGPGGKHYINAGTSMAAPVVTGTIALMMQAAKDRGRTLQPDTITRLLHRTVTNDTATGGTIGYKYGYGKLNAFEAVKAVADNLSASEFVSVNAASYAPDTVAAPGAILAGFGAGLSTNSVSATVQPLPVTLDGVRVRITASNGQEQDAGLFFVSPGQINYLLPSGLAPGVAKVDILRNGATTARGAVSVSGAWPGLFTANSFGTGLGAANVLRVRNGQLIYQSPATPIDLGIAGDQVFLVLYGTGLRGVSASRIRAYLGGAPLNTDFIGDAPGFSGLDQINLPLPASLAGRGQLDLLLYADTWRANTIQFTIK